MLAHKLFITENTEIKETIGIQILNILPINLGDSL